MGISALFFILVFYSILTILVSSSSPTHLSNIIFIWRLGLCLIQFLILVLLLNHFLLARLADFID